VVLIDGDSASASEIFAGAIQDSGRGKIVGSRSYGKGSVQGIFALGTSGAGARLTTARFFSPLGHPISNVGITPDIDARRATLVANGAEPPGSTNYVSAFRGGINSGSGDGSASLANSAAPSTPAGTQTSAPTTDPALEVAIEAARKEPVAKL
jgi:carboxyl-terminal processing protease